MKLILVDFEYTHLVRDAKAQVIVCKDTGRFGDPYEEFLSKGRQHSNEKGWPGLFMESDEDSGATLCYTYVGHIFLVDNADTCFLLPMFATDLVQPEE